MGKDKGAFSEACVFGLDYDALDLRAQFREGIFYKEGLRMDTEANFVLILMSPMLVGYTLISIFAVLKMWDDRKKK